MNCIFHRDGKGDYVANADVAGEKVAQEDLRLVGQHERSVILLPLDTYHTLTRDRNG